MKTYHPKSWSQQAREKGNSVYRAWIAKNEPLEVFNMETGEYETIYGEQAAMWQLNNSYRHPLIVNRAAKRVGRLARKHKK